MPKKPLLALLTVTLFVIPFGTADSAETENISPWKAHAEFSYVNTSGNSDNQTLAGKLEIKREEEQNRIIIKGSTLYAKDNDQEKANKWILDGRVEKNLFNKIFGFLNASYLRDKLSGYDYRAAIGPGIAYDLLKNDEHYLKSSASILYNYDRFSLGAEESDKYVSSKTEFNYQWQIRENLKLKQNLDYSISFEDTEKYFINYETAIEVKITSVISLGLTYTINYQNKLPEAGIKKTDKTFLTSLIIDF